MNIIYPVIPVDLREIFKPKTRLIGVLGKPDGTIVASGREIGFIPHRGIKLGQSYIVSDSFDVVHVDNWDSYQEKQQELKNQQCTLKAVEVLERMIATKDKRAKKGKDKPRSKSKEPAVKPVASALNKLLITSTF